MSQQSDENEQVLRWKNARERLAERAQDVRNASVDKSFMDEYSTESNNAAKLALSLYNKACSEYVAAYHALPEHRQ